MLFERSKNLHGSGLLAPIFRRRILRLLTNVKIRSESKTKASRLSPSLPPLDVTCSVLAIQNVNLPFYFWPIRLSIQLVPISKHASDNILTHVLTCTWLRYHVTVFCKTIRSYLCGIYAALGFEKYVFIRFLLTITAVHSNSRS